MRPPAARQPPPVPFPSGADPLTQPEFSESKTVGFVYSPSAVEGLSVGLDWWNIRIDNTIVSDTPNEIMEDCYVALIEARCALFSRSAALGYIVDNLQYGVRNSGYAETEGYDLDVNYALTTDYGRFSARWATTYVSMYETKSTNDPEEVPSQANGFGGTFRVRSNLNLSWNYNDFGVSWGVRYNSGSKESCAGLGPDGLDHCSLPDYQAPDTLGAVVPQNEVGSATFNDLQFSWNAPWNARIAVGANNVLDKDPPIYYSQPSSGFAFYGGHDIGRFIYARYTQKF